MRRHISTTIAFLSSLLGFVFLGSPFFTISVANETFTGYRILTEDTSALTGKYLSSYNMAKTGVIALIVLLSLTVLFCVVKLLIDLKVLKIRRDWPEWVILGLLALTTVFAFVAFGGVNSFCGLMNTDMGTTLYSVEYGVIVAVIIFVLLLAVDIAWAIIRQITYKKLKSNK